MIHKFVFIRTRFTGFHRWKDAEEKYLRDYHRHEFHVELAVRVTRDREIEFIALKNKIHKFLNVEYEGKRFEASCEEIAQHLMDAFKAFEVSVSEDGENGATLINQEENE